MTTRVLVTGAAGFVGSAVAAHLVDQGVEVAAILRAQTRRSRLDPIQGRLLILDGDVSEPGSYVAALRDFRPEVCLHLAWYAEPGRYLHAPENLGSLSASLALMQALSAVGCGHLIGVGSCAEYDLGYGLLKETTPTRPDTLYAAAKLGFALCAEQLAHQVGMTFSWARLFYLYGPGDDARRLIPAAITTLARGDTFDATAGEQVRDYLHIADAAAGLWAIANARAAGTYNVCSGVPVRVADLLGLIAADLDQTSHLRLGAIPYRAWEPMFVCGDPTRLKSQTGWAPEISLRDGLSRLTRAALTKP